MNFVRHPLSAIGAALVTSSALVFIVVFCADLFGLHTNPYLGIAFFLILPAIFVFGLLLVAAGAWLARRRERLGRPRSTMAWPSIDLNDPVQRQAAFIIALLTLANIVIVSLAAYRGVEYMDSVAFCGAVCHTVMSPEYTAHQDGPHARVACVDCHIGPGATWFVRSKVSGTRQVFAVAFASHPRPLPSPVKNLRPARETCERCHWSDKFVGDKVVRIAEYGNDEKNTPSVTTLQLHVGGGRQAQSSGRTIHWHANPDNAIEYVTTDVARQTIPYVRLRDRSGKVSEFVVDGTTPAQLAGGERRRMDCMDCHNRPTHAIAATAEEAIDAALASRQIPDTLPFVRREAVNAVKASYPSQEAGLEAIDRALRAFYGEVPTTTEREVDRAVEAARNVYRRNVFPAMKVTFGTYPTNLGHADFPGCFRCHDDSHKTKDGRVIKQDCDLCHTVS